MSITSTSTYSRFLLVSKSLLVNAGLGLGINAAKLSVSGSRMKNGSATSFLWKVSTESTASDARWQGSWPSTSSPGFQAFHETPLVEELVRWVMEGQNEEGLWKADSVFQMYKCFDFAQKREASGWITFLC